MKWVLIAVVLTGCIIVIGSRDNKINQRPGYEPDVDIFTDYDSITIQVDSV